MKTKREYLELAEKDLAETVGQFANDYTTWLVTRAQVYATLALAAPETSHYSLGNASIALERDEIPQWDSSGRYTPKDFPSIPASPLPEGPLPVPPLTMEDPYQKAMDHLDDNARAAGMGSIYTNKIADEAAEAQAKLDELLKIIVREPGRWDNILHARDEGAEDYYDRECCTCGVGFTDLPRLGKHLESWDREWKLKARGTSMVDK